MDVAKCPQYGNVKMWKDGIRETRDGDVQRYLCRTCGYRFSPHRSDKLKRPQHRPSAALNPPAALLYDRQVRRQGAKNLATVEPLRDGLAGATTPSDAAVKGTLLEYAWWMKKEGYDDVTIKGRSYLIQRLAREGADRSNPESVKETLALQPWAAAYRVTFITAYSSFCKMRGIE